MRSGQIGAARRKYAVAASLALLPLIGGCAQIRTQQGYIVDNTLVSAVTPGVDNRVSVERTLGRPTFVGQFDDSEWYYVSRQMRQLAFANPRPVEQLVLRVTFDAAGNVAAVDRSGIDKVVRVSPDGDKTPTLGRNRSFFEDLFGNIGSVGAGGAPGGGGGAGGQ